MREEEHRSKSISGVGTEGAGRGGGGGGHCSYTSVLSFELGCRQAPPGVHPVHVPSS